MSRTGGPDTESPHKGPTQLVSYFESYMAKRDRYGPIPLG
jgi:hypothetical protein